MNNQAPIEHPEQTSAYRQGAESWHRGFRREACPWDFGEMMKRHLWLAGWHDTDMALSEGRNQ